MIPLARPYLGEEESNAVRAVVQSRWVAQGPRVRQFEESFAKCVGAKHACAVSSCTAALHLAGSWAERTRTTPPPGACQRGPGFSSLKEGSAGRAADLTGRPSSPMALNHTGIIEVKCKCSEVINTFKLSVFAN